MVTTVTPVLTYWQWTYDVTPVKVDGIQGFTLYLGSYGMSQLVPPLPPSSPPPLVGAWNSSGWEVKR